MLKGSPNALKRLSFFFFLYFLVSRLDSAAWKKKIIEEEEKEGGEGEDNKMNVCSFIMRYYLSALH